MCKSYQRYFSQGSCGHQGGPVWAPDQTNISLYVTIPKYVCTMYNPYEINECLDSVAKDRKIDAFYIAARRAQMGT